MNKLTGTYECKVDVKGRFMTPSSLKKDLASVLADGFVMKRSVFQSCLELYPMSYWNKQMEVINKKLNPFNRKHNAFLRKFTAGVKKIEVDATGRILIPKDLCVFANIKKEIVLTGVGDILEIWDK
ncbi:MAG: division/cell wall cluster transcriptional repressor MraZ, partial [Polaribacter sp.]